MKEVRMVPIEKIVPNPYQPRLEFNQESLMDLAQSIRENGLIQPITLKENNGRYEIIAGERRYRACMMIGLTEVAANIMDVSDVSMAELALVENIQRENLSAIEEAKALASMSDKLHLTQEELAKRIGKSREYVANMMRLLNLPEELQNMVLSGELSMGHVRPLITLEKDEAIKIARRTKEENLSVREVENIVKGLELQKNRKNKPKPEKNQHYTYAEGLLRKKYRTKVKIEDN